MEQSKDRRKFLRDMGVLALGGAAGIAFTKEALAGMMNVPINTKARAVMPDGSLKTRAELMRKMGLNPGAPPDAWLSIIACGSNAAGITQHQREILIQRGMRFRGNELIKPTPAPVRPGR